MAGGIIEALVIVVMALVDDPVKTRALQLWLRIPAGMAAFWFVFGPLWNLVFFRREPARDGGA